MHPFGREPLAEGVPDPAGRSGDDRDLSPKLPDQVSPFTLVVFELNSLQVTYTVDDHTRTDPRRDGAAPPPTSQASPLWLGAVRRFERLIGVPIERMVTSNAYFDTLPTLRRTQAQMADYVASLTDDWFRLFNLPAGSDVRRMREQLSRMERQLEKLSKQLAEREERPKPAARKRDQTP